MLVNTRIYIKLHRYIHVRQSVCLYTHIYVFHKLRISGVLPQDKSKTGLSSQMTQHLQKLNSKKNKEKQTKYSNQDLPAEKK